MNIAAAQTFLAILETGSMVRAAERLNVTQSTVTARIKGLEQALGQPLFLRRKTGIQLTDAGAKFRHYAAAMTSLWRQAQQETGRSRGVHTVCNIGCHLDLWPGLGRCLFDEIDAAHAGGALTAWPGVPSELGGWLSAGLVNLVLAYQPFARLGHTARILTSERLVLVSSRAGTAPRSDPGYVYVDCGDEFGRQHAAAYADTATARISFGSAVWALGHLLAKGGSGYLPERLAAPHLASGALHRVAGAPAFARPVYLVTNDAAAAGWPWLDAFVARMADPPREAAG